jgi:hypothetical protein
MRQSVEAGERINPRYFLLPLVRAEGELEAAIDSRAEGRDPSPCLGVASRECQKGLGMKSDEARFHSLLARIAAFRAEGLQREGRPAQEPIQEGFRQVHLALAICPTQRTAAEVRKALEGLEGTPQKAGRVLPPPDRTAPGLAPGL